MAVLAAGAALADTIASMEGANRAMSRFSRSAYRVRPILVTAERRKVQANRKANVARMQRGH